MIHLDIPHSLSMMTLIPTFFYLPLALLFNVFEIVVSVRQAGFITCIGTPSQELPDRPAQVDFDPNASTMQLLCAKTAYGGGTARRNIGG